MNRFLVVNPHGVGDVLFSTPLLRSLKERFPEAHFGYLCNRRAEEILETHPLVERLFVYEKDEFREKWRRSKKEFFRSLWSLYQGIRKERYDLAVDLSLAPEFSFFLMCAGIPKRVGLDYKKRGRFLTDRVFLSGFDEKPVTAYYLETLRSLGVEGGSHRTELWTTEEDERFAKEFLERQGLPQEKMLIGVCPGGGASFGDNKRSYRHWGESPFSELCNLLQERLERKILLFCGPGEEKICEEVLRGCRRVPLLAPRTTIRQMAGLMKRCALVVTNDGGPLHVAVASGVPTLSLFGPVDEAVYGPYVPNRSHRILTQPVPCRPCYRRFKLPECERNVCLQWIEPSRVFEAVKECLTR